MIWIFPLANASHPAATRHVTPEVLGGFDGFADYVRRHCIPTSARLGIPCRVMWWCPFGFRDPSLYDFTAYPRALEIPEMRKACETFTDVLAPLTREGVEQWVYMGIDGLHEPNTADRLQLLAASTRPYLDAGMHLIVDAAANAARDHPAVVALESLRNHGVRVGVEGKPAHSHEYSTVEDGPLFMDDDDHRGIMRQHPAGGELMVWVRQREPLHEIGRAKAYQRLGITPAVNLWGLIGRGVRIEEVW